MVWNFSVENTDLAIYGVISFGIPRLVQLRAPIQYKDDILPV